MLRPRFVGYGIVRFPAGALRRVSFRGRLCRVAEPSVRALQFRSTQSFPGALAALGGAGDGRFLSLFVIAGCSNDGRLVPLGLDINRHIVDYRFRFLYTDQSFLYYH